MLDTTSTFHKQGISRNTCSNSRGVQSISHAHVYRLLAEAQAYLHVSSMGGIGITVQGSHSTVYVEACVRMSVVVRSATQRTSAVCPHLYLTLTLYSWLQLISKVVNVPFALQLLCLDDINEISVVHKRFDSGGMIDVCIRLCYAHIGD
jgi:hypothetical protein